MIKSSVFLRLISVIAPPGPVSGLVPQTARHISGSGGCGRGTERVEDSAGSGESVDVEDSSEELLRQQFSAKKNQLGIQRPNGFFMAKGCL